MADRTMVLWQPSVLAHDNLDGTYSIGVYDPAVIADLADIAAVLGAVGDAATLDNMSALATATAISELKRILLRMSTDAFTATVQGVARVELDTMVAQLATYFVAAGAAFSQTINPGSAARTAIDACLKDLSDMIAGGGITTYPAAAVPGNGVSTAQVIRKIYDLVALIPTTAMRGTDGAALAVVLGALADAAHAGVVDNATTGMAYLKQLVTLLLLVPTTAMRGTDAAMLAVDGATIWRVQAPVSVSLAAIDTTLTNSPPTAAPDAENTILDLAITSKTLYKISDLLLKVSSYGTGASITIKVWRLLNGSVRAQYVTAKTIIVPTDYAITEYLSLADLCGAPTLEGEGIVITAQTDVGNTGALTCTYVYEKAVTP